MCLRRFFISFVTLSILFCHLFVCFAVESEDSSSSDSSEASGSDAPIAVQIIEPDQSYSVASANDAVSNEVSSIGDSEPSSSPFYGACWVSGYDSSLGNITVYFPTSCKKDFFGLDSNGYLFNISGSSTSGYLNGVYNNSVSCSSFSYPRYRESNTSTYNYTNLYLKVTDSNMEIATENTDKYSASDLLPYVCLLFLGGVLLCCMKRS